MSEENDTHGKLSAEAMDAAVRRVVYSNLIDAAHMPLSGEIARDLGCSTEEVWQAFGRLSQAHILVLQGEGREILMANPFSAVPTPFVVRAGGKSWWGNCIWDALGIAAMIKVDTTITTACADCNDALAVHVENGTVWGDPQNMIHFSVSARRWWDNITFT